MLTAEQINSIHRLHWAEHWSVRKIARHLHLGRRTISQYLVTPARSSGDLKEEGTAHSSSTLLSILTNS
jgi:DNA-binding transcriptional regulator LsrR (DeoR family)